MRTTGIKILIDVDAGEADIKTSDWFESEGGLWRADVLKDVIGLLNQKYDKALQDFAEENNYENN